MHRVKFTLLVLVIGCLVAVSCTRDFKANNVKFDSAIWKTLDLRARGAMTQDLLASNLLKGKLKTEVREILGEPDNINKAGQFVYQTDPGAWMGGANNGPWIHWLHVEFEIPDGGVAKAYVTD